MRFLLIPFLSLSLLFVACKHNEGPTNDYKNAKTHPSDREAKSRKKLTKAAEKQAHKNMRHARKAQRKKQRGWFKKGSYE